MLEQIKQIALRLRELRSIEGLSAEEMAKTCNISIDLYNTYENGDIEIPMSVLYNAAGKLGVELTELLSGDSPRLKVYQLIRAGRGMDVERSKAYKYQNLAYSFRGKKGEFFTVEVPEGSDKAEVSLNSHTGHEFNYVLEGTLKLTINGTELTMNPGDSLYFDASYAHGMQAVGGSAKFLAIIF